MKRHNNIIGVSNDKRRYGLGVIIKPKHDYMMSHRTRGRTYRELAINKTDIDGEVNQLMIIDKPSHSPTKDLDGYMIIAFPLINDKRPFKIKPVIKQPLQ